MPAVTILGNNSAIPAFDRHPTAQVVTMDDQLLLFDCGEGSQMQMNRYKIRRSRINHIFISHLHGDHYFGLPGLLTSMGLMSRQEPLHLYGPPPLKNILDTMLQYSETVFPYELNFHPIEQEGILVNTGKFQVRCFPLIHRIECWGFRVDQLKAPRKILADVAAGYQIPVTCYEQIKQGQDYVTPGGVVIKNDILTISAAKSKSYAYVADTAYYEPVIEQVHGVTTLYHETTYLKDKGELATLRHHCTTEQAATIAQKAGVGKLLIGHFSSKYEDLSLFQQEAREVFPNTELALEGVSYII